MKVFWNPDCLLHDPPYEFLSGDRLPYFESPLRLQLIKKELEEHPSLFTFESISSSESESTLDILRYVQMVHSPGYLRYLGNAYDNWVGSGGSTVLLQLPSSVIDYLVPSSLFLLRTPCYLNRFHTRSSSLDQVRFRSSPSLPLLKQVRRYSAYRLTPYVLTIMTLGYYCFDLSCPITKSKH